MIVITSVLLVFRNPSSRLLFLGGTKCEPKRRSSIIARPEQLRGSDCAAAPHALFGWQAWNSKAAQKGKANERPIEVTGHNLEARGREEVNRLLKAGWRLPSTHSGTRKMGSGGSARWQSSVA